MIHRCPLSAPHRAPASDSLTAASRWLRRLARWPSFLLAFVFAASGLATQALAQAAARTAQDPMPLTDPVYAATWWIDTPTAPGAAVAEPPADAPWQPLATLARAQLRQGQRLWIRFSVPPTPKAERCFLEVPYSSVDRVTLYGRDAQAPATGGWQALHVAGDAVPVSSWPVPYRYPLLPIATTAGAPTAYLLRVENMHGFQAPLQLASESEVHRTDQRVALVLGAFFGLAALACAISVISAVSLRDRTYWLYAASVLLMTLTQAAMTGMAGLHLWPGSPVWTDRAPFALSTLGVAVMMLVLTGIVSTRERSPALYRVVLALFGTGVAASLAMALSTQPWRGAVTALCVSTSSVVTAGVMFWAWWRGDRYAPWMLLGTLPVAAGAAFPLARLMGWGASNEWAQYTMQLGIAIELPVVLVVLMLRSQQKRESVRRIHSQAHTDPATGLVTEPVFLKRAQRMAHRAARREQACAMFVVDVCNLADLQRKFGRSALADVPLRVASRILSVARDIDTVARLGEYRFGVLVEGPLAPGDIESLGPRLVARCLMPHKRKPAEWVTRVRVASAVLPHARQPAARVVELLHDTLDGLPEDSRKAVFMLGDAPPASGSH